MPNIKTREIIIHEDKGVFSILQKLKISKQDYDFSSLLSLRQLLSNEKARMLHVIKTEKPDSIYSLAKKLNRGFKCVFDDVKLLERWGFIELIEEKTKHRIRHKPVISASGIVIKFNI